MPHDLATFGLEEIRKSRDEWRAWQKFLEENPNATQEQKLEELSKRRKIPTKEEIEKGITLFNFLMDNHEKLKLALEVSKKPDMFSIPANSIMFSLLAMFAGKPNVSHASCLKNLTMNAHQKNKSRQKSI